MASAVIGALRVNLGIDSAEFWDGLKRVQKDLGSVGRSMAKVGAGMSAAITAPVVAMGAGILRTAGNFEASMSRIGAVTGASASQMKQLELAARDMGKSTIFSATEAADAMEVLAKNGLSTEQILGGAAQAALDMAAATGSDMAGAADVASSIMLAFNKNAKDLGTVVDDISGVINASSLDFDDYRLAIGQVAGVAGGLGVEFEDMNAALVATAPLFTSGSDAGTSFKTFLQRLVPQSKEAAAAMDRLGLEFFDAQGNMKSMADISGELREATAGLTEEARNADFNTIFGTDAMRTAIGLSTTTAEKFREIQQVIGDTSAAEQAAARLGPYNAAIEQLSGAWEELQLTLASSGFIETITQLVTKVTEFVNAISQSNPALLQWGVAIAAIAAAAGPVVVVLGTLAIGIAAIGAPIALAITAITAIVAAIVYFREDIRALMVAVNEFATGAIDRFISGVQELAASISSFVSGAWAQFVAAWDGIVAKVDEVKAKIIEFAQSIPQIFSDLAAQMVEIGANIIAGLWQGIQGGFAEVYSGMQGFASGLASKFMGWVGVQSPSVIFREIGAFMMEGLGLGMEDQQSYVVGVARDTADQAVGATKDAWAGLRETTTEVKSGFDSLFSSIGSNIAEVIKGTKSFSEALKDVLGQLGSSLFQSGIQALFGGGGGAGGLFSSLFSGLFGFAQGGSFQVGGAGGIDSQLVAFKASPNERVSVTKPGQEERHGMQIMVTSRFLADGTFESVVDQRAQKVAAPMVQSGMKQANSAVVPTVSRYQRDQAGSDYRIV